MKTISRLIVLSVVFFLAATIIYLTVPGRALAASAKEIEINVAATIDLFKEKVNGGPAFLKSAKAVLVFPRVYKAGIGVGGEYGEGALQVDGKTVDYYSTVAGSIGFQLGAQRKSVVIVFMTGKALKDFRNSEGWKAGVDGSVAIAEWGVGEDINTVDFKDPIIGFVFNNKGLMYNLTLEGSKFSKIKK